MHVRRAHRRRSTEQRRQLHLIDIENLLGEARLTATVDEVRSVVEQWLRHVGRRAGDHVVIACNPAFGVVAGLAVPGGQLLVRHGKDGADKALMEWAPIDHIVDRYDRVVLGSGDGIFATFATSLRGRGARVHACTRQGAMSRALRLAVESSIDAAPALELAS